MKLHRDVTRPVVKDLPPRDETAALEAAGGDVNLACELVDTLVRGLPKELADLRSCFQGDDWPALAETAHRLRGATSYCGVPALDTGLQELERAAGKGDPQQIGSGLLRVEQEAERLTRAVESKDRI